MLPLLSPTPPLARKQQGRSFLQPDPFLLLFDRKDSSLPSSIRKKVQKQQGCRIAHSISSEGQNKSKRIQESQKRGKKGIAGENINAERHSKKGEGAN